MVLQKHVTRRKSSQQSKKCRSQLTSSRRMLISLMKICRSSMRSLSTVLTAKCWPGDEDRRRLLSKCENSDGKSRRCSEIRDINLIKANWPAGGFKKLFWLSFWSRTTYRFSDRALYRQNRMLRLLFSPRIGTVGGYQSRRPWWTISVVPKDRLRAFDGQVGHELFAHLSCLEMVFLRLLSCSSYKVRYLECCHSPSSSAPCFCHRPSWSATQRIDSFLLIFV